MSTESAIRILAGSLILLSLVLYLLVSPWGLLIGGFVAFNLIQSAFTGFCPAENVLVRCGIGRNAACSTESRST